MKPIITILILFILFSAKAQTINTTYIAQPDLKKFAGEWQYTSNDTVFTLNLKLIKKYITIGDGIYVDLIYGDYAIKKGGHVLLLSSSNRGISSGTYVDKNVSKDKIHFLFYDLGRKRKSGDVVFELLDADTANWKLTNTEGVRIGYYDYSFSVPVKAV
ncbi:DUF6705 family protein [Mucilaginibacter phyllosphaerae]